MTGTKRSWNVPVGGELAPGRHVIERLGGGRRTEVYRCTDVASGTPVAVKILRPGRTGERDLRMLTREADTLADLDHPGFPRLVDHALDADPAWIVMSQVDGPHVSALVADHGPLELDQAVPLARDVSDALAHLHDRGRVHLDVKPSNVVMGTAPVLLDLGASRTIHHAAGLRAGVGTRTWMAPEQAAPDRFGAPGPPADVWGLGMVLLHALTGTNPLDARREQTSVDEATLAAACLAATSAVPSRLRVLVAACLALDPGNRPKAAEVTEAAGVPGGGGTLRRLSTLLRGPRPGEVG